MLGAVVAGVQGEGTADRVVVNRNFVEIKVGRFREGE